MADYPITIIFMSDWHVGSGLGDGAIADSIINRDASGLPFIPGRAIKGSLRESAWRLGLCREDLRKAVTKLFGSFPGDPEAIAAGVEPQSNEPGLAHVSPGQLPEKWREYLKALDAPRRSLFVGDMTIHRQQTSLLENGQVRPHSLRSIECGIPGLMFEADIAIEADDPWLAEYFRAVCAGLRSIGADRARGLGNCEVKLAGQGGAPVKLPPPTPRWLLGDEK